MLPLKQSISNSSGKGETESSKDTLASFSIKYQAVIQLCFNTLLLSHLIFLEKGKQPWGAVEPNASLRRRSKCFLGEATEQ